MPPRRATGRRALAALLAVLGSASCSASAPDGRSSGSPATGQPAGMLVVLVLGGGTCTQHAVTPSCLPQPLAGAEVVVSGAGRDERLRSDREGRAQLRVPRGRFRVTALPVEGWPVTPPPQEVLVGEAGVTVRLVHSTGFQ